MEQSANVGEDGVVSSSSAAATGGRAVSVSRWTSTAWSADQPVTSHGHQVIAECPGCIAEQGKPHVCDVDELLPSTTSLDFQMRAARSHQRTVVGPHAPHYVYTDVLPTSYAVPPTTRYTYGPPASSVHHADYQTCYERARCTCGDHGCAAAQFSVHDMYSVGSHHQSQYYPHHVASPHHTPPVYPAHQVVYPGDHFQIIRPPPSATHYRHHRYRYPSPSSSAETHFVRSLPGDVAPRPMTATLAERDENVSRAPVVSGDSLTADTNKVDTVSSASDISRHNVDDVEPSTSAPRADYDVIRDTVEKLRVISQSMSALTASRSSECISTSVSSPVTSHSGSAELVPVRDVAPAAAADRDAADADRRMSQHAPHHGSMSFIVDFSDAGHNGSSSRNPATPLSECLPPRLRRKSVQHRTERDDRDEDHDAEVRRKGKSPMTSRKWRDVTEGVGQTSRMAALTRSPLTKKRHGIANSSTVTAQAAASSDEDADQTTTVSDVAKKKQAWSKHDAHSLTEADGTSRDSDVTSGASQTPSTSSSRLQKKKRQLLGTETDIMHNLLYAAAKPPNPSSQLNERPVRPEPIPENLKTASYEEVTSSRGNAVDVDVLEAKRSDCQTDSDNESNASAGTYTLESDDKEEIRQQRARIDEEFGIVSDGAASNDRPSTGSSGAQLDTEDSDKDERSLEIHEDSDGQDHPRLKRTQNQTLFPRSSAGGGGVSGVSFSDGPPLNVDHHPDADEAEVAGRRVSLTPDSGPEQTEWTSSQSCTSRLHADVDDAVVHDGLDSTFSCQDATPATETSGTAVKNSEDHSSIRDDDDDDQEDYDDGLQATAAASSLKASTNYPAVRGVNMMTSLAQEVDQELLNTDDVILCIHESGDELEEADVGVAKTRQRSANSQQQTGDDVTNSTSGLVGRRQLPLLPKTSGDGSAAADVVAKTVHRRARDSVKTATNCDSGRGDGKRDDNTFVADYDATSSEDVRPRQGDVPTKTNWSSDELRHVVEKKLRRRTDNQNDESTASTTTANRTRTTSPSDVTKNDARTRTTVRGGKQLPTTPDRFHSISDDVKTKLSSKTSQLSAVDRSKARPPASPASGAPNSGGSRSARTTPQQRTLSPIRARSKSNARDEIDRTTTTTTTTGARTAGVRSNEVNDDSTRRYPTRNSVIPDSVPTTRRQPVVRSTVARQNGPPPVQTSTRSRSTSQKRSSEVGGGVGRQVNQDASRSSQYRSPDRGRTSKRQTDVVSKKTDEQTTSYSMHRSMSANVLPTPRRTASRSPQRPFVPPSIAEQERRQTAHEAFRKRMSYDPSKSVAQARAGAAEARKTRGSCDGSTERLSPWNGDHSRRSSQGSSSGVSDDEAFVRSAAAVASFSSSVAGGINAMSQLVEDGDAPTKPYDRVLLSTIMQLSENVRLCSDRLHDQFRKSAGGSVTSEGKSSPRSNAYMSHRASDCTLKLEEILHNLAYSERRLQSCTQMYSSVRRLS